MSENKTEETSAKTSESSSKSRRPPLSNQLVGAVVGAVVVLLALRIGTQVGWWQPPARETGWILLGAFVGSLASSLGYYDRAGAHLTGRQSQGNKTILALNVFVALLGMAVIMGLIFALSSLVGMLFLSK